MLAVLNRDIHVYVHSPFAIMLLAQWIVLGVWSMGRGLNSIRVIGGV